MENKKIKGGGKELLPCVIHKIPYECIENSSHESLWWRVEKVGRIWRPGRIWRHIGAWVPANGEKDDSQSSFQRETNVFQKWAVLLAWFHHIPALNYTAFFILSQLPDISAQPRKCCKGNRGIKQIQNFNIFPFMLS